MPWPMHGSAPVGGDCDSRRRSDVLIAAGWLVRQQLPEHVIERQRHDRVVRIGATRRELGQTVDTLGGLACVIAEQVPPVGTIVEHESGWRIEVTEGSERQVTRLRLHPPVGGDLDED